MKSITSDWKFIGSLALCILLGYRITTLVYNLYFHPLADFPGPFLGRASLVKSNRALAVFSYIDWEDTPLYCTLAPEIRCGKGPIVRISPDELSFGSVEFWKAIYGHPTPQKPIPTKAAFYEVFSAGFRRRCIGSERDPHKHSQMRKMLSPAFSQRALLEQESIIGGIVDRFIHIIGERAAPGSNGINMTKWFEMGSFDILGEMAFGESFHSLENGNHTSYQIQITLLTYSLRKTAFLGRSHHGTPLLDYPCGQPETNWSYCNPFQTPGAFGASRAESNSRYSRNQVEKCLASTSSRKDFVTLLANKVREGEVDKEEMAAHVSTFAIQCADYLELVLPEVKRSQHFWRRQPAFYFNTLTNLSVSYRKSVGLCILRGCQGSGYTKLAISTSYDQRGSLTLPSWLLGLS
ncbi:cytochrome P450 [Penicillium sp. IBT 35674x]|nr:cytochrome P450 [Penicillium sp. IBT 35674x]